MKKLLSILLGLSLMLIFAGCEFNFSVGDTGDDDTANDTADTSEETSTLTNLFNTDKFGYTINYPTDWQKQEDATNYTAMFANGKASVAIQNLASTAMGGTYATADDVVTEFKKQLNQATNVKIEDGADLPYTMADGTQLTAKQFIVEYTIPEDNATYKQWQIVLPRTDGQVFHAWSYTSLVENYETYLPIAQEMLASWKLL